MTVTQEPFLPCKRPGCPGITRERDGWCSDTCREYGRELKRAVDRRYRKINNLQRREKTAARGYDATWRKVRRMKLRRNPICEICKRNPASQVHHKRKIGERPDLRLDMENLQACCVSCHRNLHKKGLPVTNFPEFVGKSAIPVTMLCGPPGAGKTTFVENNKEQSDIVIDLDVIKRELSGQEHPDKSWLNLAVRQRNNILASLATESGDKRAWFIIPAPKLHERRWWKQKLGVESVVVLAVGSHECIRRIVDSRGQEISNQMEPIIHRWWKQYIGDHDETVIVGG